MGTQVVIIARIGTVPTPEIVFDEAVGLFLGC